MNSLGAPVRRAKKVRLSLTGCKKKSHFVNAEACAGKLSTHANRLGAVVPEAVGTCEQIRRVLACLQLDRDVSFRRAVRKLRPSELSAMLPDIQVRFGLVHPHQVPGLVQKNHRTLGVVGGAAVEIRIERDDLKREVCRGEGILLFHKKVEPVIRLAKRGRVPQQDHFGLEASLLKQVNGAVDSGALVRGQESRS